MREKYREFLLNHPLLKTIGDRGIESISSIASFLTLKKGEILFKEGSEGEDLYIILDGEVEVLKGEDKVKIAELSKGEIVGEISFLLKCGRTATLIAKNDCVLFRIDGKILEDKILSGEKSYIEILFFLSRTLAERLNKTNEEFFKLVKKEILDKDEFKDLKEKLKEGLVF